MKSEAVIEMLSPSMNRIISAKPAIPDPQTGSWPDASSASESADVTTHLAQRLGLVATAGIDKFELLRFWASGRWSSTVPGFWAAFGSVEPSGLVVLGDVDRSGFPHQPMRHARGLARSLEVGRRSSILRTLNRPRSTPAARFSGLRAPPSCASDATATSEPPKRASRGRWPRLLVVA